MQKYLRKILHCKYLYISIAMLRGEFLERPYRICTKEVKEP